MSTLHSDGSFVDTSSERMLLGKLDAQDTLDDNGGVAHVLVVLAT
jgi:hypothetical protein